MLTYMWQFLRIELLLLAGAVIVALVLIVAASVYGRLWPKPWLRDPARRLWGKLRDINTGKALLGVAAYFLWPPVFLLQCLLVAVLLELFFTGTDEVDVPGAGRYYVLAVIAAGLLVAAQSFLPVFLRHLRTSARDTDRSGPEVLAALNRASTSVLGVVICLMIVQMWLGVWRGILAQGGQHAGLPTIWSGVLEAGGPVVGALLVGAYLVSCTLLPYVLFHWLMVPFAVGVVAAVVRGLTGHSGSPDR